MEGLWKNEKKSTMENLTKNINVGEGKSKNGGKNEKKSAKERAVLQKDSEQ